MGQINSDLNLVCDQFLQRFGAKNYKDLIKILHPDKVVQTEDGKRNFLNKFYSGQVNDEILNDKEVTTMLVALFRKAWDCFSVN